MSIVALKRKSKALHHKTVSRGQFSLNGGIRNRSSSGVGGSSAYISNPSKARFDGIDAIGHGSCCGKYSGTYSNSGYCSNNDSSIIKPSVLNTKGRISKMTRCNHKCGAIVVKGGKYTNRCRDSSDTSINNTYHSSDLSVLYENRLSKLKNQSINCGDVISTDAGNCATSCGVSSLPSNMNSIKSNTNVNNYSKNLYPLQSSDYIQNKKYKNTCSN